MGSPFLGEIRMFAGNFAPVGWAFCEGQEISIAENSSLYDLIGTTYGGDGQETMALPDLRGRAPMHTDAFDDMGTSGGAADVTLTPGQLPSHTHPLTGSADQGTFPDPGNHVVAGTGSASLYMANEVPDVTLNPAAIASAGGGQPHANVQPYLCLPFIISLYGPYPLPPPP